MAVNKMSFESFENALNIAIRGKRISGAAVAATDKTDKIQYNKAYGHTSADATAAPMQQDSVMWIASCTKLMTAISVMQCVERGLLNLDASISSVLHEWKCPDIILGFDEVTGNSLTKKATAPITLRQLLTHSSGMGYDGLNPTLRHYRKSHRGREPSYEIKEIAEDHTVALTFEPGQGWDYGSGIDWAGQMVERVNNGQRLGDYMDEHIWQPLGMSSTTFQMLKRPDLMQRACGLSGRRPDGTLALDNSGVFPIIEPSDDSGGSGLYSCASDYIKLLVSLLRDDGKLLKSESVAELSRPQLRDTTYLENALAGPLSQYLTPGMPPGTKWNHALGGIIAVDGIPGRVGRGTMMWSGLPNSYWFVDFETGFCGLYFSHLLPPGDPETAALYAEFQAAVHSANT